MADDTENEGVRILGAQEAREIAHTGKEKSRYSKKTRQPVVTAPTGQTSNIDLPHWSEAPTGEVPEVSATDQPGDGWEALTGSQPRIRVEQTQWNDVDYDPALSLNDESLNIGALGFDHLDLTQEDKFDQEVAQKRAQVPAAVGATAGGQKGDDQKIAKISTVPDTATTAPIQGEAPSPVQTSKVKTPAQKARRDKRVDSNDNSDQSGDDSTPRIQTEASTLITRTATAVVLAVVAIFCLMLGTIPTLIFAAVVLTAMSLELCEAFRKIGAKPAGLLVAVMTFFSVITGYMIGDRAIAVSGTIFFAFTALWYLFSIVKARPVIGLAMSSLVYIYVGMLGSFAGMILALENSKGNSIGIFVLLSTVLCVAANDTAAYLFGKFMGRTPLAPAISPNKTMEGTTAGIIAAIVVGIFLSYSVSDNVWGDVKGGFVLGTLIAIGAIFGDLIESMLKRDCKLKDFGTLLPGHGGLMDRFDGLLIALPIAYYLALVLT